MIRVLTFVSFLVLIAKDVTAKVSLDISDDELSKINILEYSNLTYFDPSEYTDHPHAHLNVTELISLYNYTVETHKVTTEDGYILELHRITGSPTNPPSNGKPKVLLQHGLLCSSMDWVIAGPKRSLGFLLADAGYDVWLGNARGNRFSRNHKNLSIKKSAFWNFSWHEIGVLDLPAMIDYILKIDESIKKVSYVGHSQGTTAFFVMLSERPEYNEKVTAMFALAPVAYCKYMSSPILRVLSKLTDFIELLMKLLGQHELKPTNEFLKGFVGFICDGSSVTQPICSNLLFLICGFNKEQLDTELLPAILTHTPAGASTKQVIHYSQLIKSGYFRQYDHGKIKNLIKYKKIRPPSYKLENIKVPVALYYSINDWLSSSKDVLNLQAELPNSIGMFRVPNDAFNHLDYLWAKDVKKLLYDQVINLMTKYKE